MTARLPSLKSLILQHMHQAPAESVWTPVDFLNLGTRDAVDKALQRLANSGELRRIDRGLYDLPRTDPFTRQLVAPDYWKVIDAVSRRDQVRVLIDGMTAANELGLTNAVPGQVIVHTDGRIGDIKLGNLTIRFKLTAPSKLYWAGRPAMRIVQALYWLRDELKYELLYDHLPITIKLTQLLRNSKQRKEIYDDLMSGLHTLPSWMQVWVRRLLNQLENNTSKD